MRELDLLMRGWLDEHYETADPDTRAAFLALLDTPDPQLLAWLTGRARPDDPAVAQLIDDIRLQRVDARRRSKWAANHMPAVVTETIRSPLGFVGGEGSAVNDAARV